MQGQDTPSAQQQQQHAGDDDEPARKRARHQQGDVSSAGRDENVPGETASVERAPGNELVVYTGDVNDAERLNTHQEGVPSV